MLKFVLRHQSHARHTGCCRFQRMAGRSSRPAVTWTACITSLAVLAGASSLSATARVEIGSVEGAPGEQVEIEVRLLSMGEAVAGIQNDIYFDPDTRVLTRTSGRPACRVNPAIGKDDSAFSLAECPGDENCLRTRALILSLSNVDPIPDGVVYTCRVQIAAHAQPPPYPLVCVNHLAATPHGEALPLGCADGAIIPLAEYPLHTRTPRPTPMATQAPPSGPPRTRMPSPTRTPTRDPNQPLVTVRSEGDFISPSTGGRSRIRAFVDFPAAPSLDGIRVTFTVDPPVGTLDPDEAVTQVAFLDGSDAAVGVAETTLIVPRGAPVGPASVTARALGAHDTIGIYIGDLRDNRGFPAAGEQVSAGSDADGCALTPRTDPFSALLLAAPAFALLFRRRRR